jgi:septum site-determining protein MinD
MTRFIAIASGKGGVGKTTAALNLGTALTNFGREIIVVDANLSTPNISLHLGTPRLPFTIHDVLKGTKHISETAYMHPSGLKVIPASIALDEIENLASHRLSDVLLDLMGTSELVLLDTPSGFSNHTEHALKASDEVIIVTNPELPAVTDALKTIKFSERLGKDVLGIIINRVTNSKSEMTIHSIEALLERPILAIIPEDDNVKKSIAIKHPVLYTHPDSPASIAYKKLAARLIGQPFKEKLK